VPTTVFIVSILFDINAQNKMKADFMKQ